MISDVDRGEGLDLVSPPDEPRSVVEVERVLLAVGGNGTASFGLPNLQGNVPMAILPAMSRGMSAWPGR